MEQGYVFWGLETEDTQFQRAEFDEQEPETDTGTGKFK